MNNPASSLTPSHGCAPAGLRGTAKGDNDEDLDGAGSPRALAPQGAVRLPCALLRADRDIPNPIADLVEDS